MLAKRNSSSDNPSGFPEATAKAEMLVEAWKRFENTEAQREE